MGGTVEAHAENVNVLFDRRLRRAGGRLPQAGIDDLHPGITQAARQHLDPAVVSIKTHFGQEHPLRQRLHGKPGVEIES
ncbi:MAG: hypothetical protein AMXMBFR20_08810 [Planctomycetia bacterium]